MTFPDGVQTVTLTAGAAGYRALDGDVYQGTIRLTPSVPRVVSAEHGVIALGAVNITLGASGEFTETVLAIDADGFEPSGWTYRVDEEFTGVPGRAYNISLPASVGTVALADLSPVESSSGTVSSPAVLSVNGETGIVTGLLEAANNLTDLASPSTARTSLGLGNSATRDVGTVANTVAAGDDSRLSDTRTPTAHAASHGSGGSDPITVAQSQVTGLATALDGKAALDGATFTGAVTLNGADLAVLGTGKGYRFRRGGGALDLEATGSDLLISNWSGTGFDGTQRSYLRLSADAQNIQIAGRAEFVDALYGTTRHVLDGAANTVGLYGATPVTRQTVTGSRADGTAVTNLLAAAAATGLIVDGTSAGIANAWRRRDLPDALIADGLHTGTAPSISTAQTTTPTAGYIKYAPAGVALTGSDVTGPFSYMGAGNFAIGAGAPDTNYVLPLSKYPNTYASGQAIWSVEFGTDAQIIQVRMKYISAATMLRLSIDGRKVTDLMQSSGGITPGSGHLISIDFGSATPRRIRLDFSTFPFGGVYIPPTAGLWGVPSEGGRLMVLGDSLSDGSAQNTGAGAGTWFARAARLLGATDAWEQGRGGTGYITAGSYATFGDRAAADVIAWNPTRLFIWGGYNDSNGSQPAIAAAAASLYAAVRAGLPSCEVYVIGCWSPTGTPAAGVTNTDATLRTAAATAGIPFISPLTGSVYNSAGTLVATHGAWITAANAAAYVGGDAVHPTDVGHIYLSRRITAAIRDLMPA